MRGKAIFARYFSARSGITPAYAGKSIICPNGELVVEDHPRLCGEKLSFCEFLTHAAGSPPPMRGKGDGMQYEIWYNRITPAYAGKSVSYEKLPSVNKDHPRLCGEKELEPKRRKSPKGSPPPMRGKDVESKGTDQKFRITPAYAGKSEPVAGKRKIDKDHPRLCGEKTKKIPKQRYFFHQPASFSFSLQYT